MTDMMKIHECPCGEGYDFHLGLIWQLVSAQRQQADHFVTLDPFLLANAETFGPLFSLRIVKPSEAVAALKSEAK